MKYSAIDLAIDIEISIKDGYAPKYLAKIIEDIYWNNIQNIEDSSVNDIMGDIILMAEGVEYELPEQKIINIIKILKLKETDPQKKELFICRVCGFFLDFLPWGRFGTEPTYEICPCCGVQFGVMDEIPMLAYQARREWFDSGSSWHDESKKPENWDIEKQLQQIPIVFK